MNEQEIYKQLFGRYSKDKMSKFLKFHKDNPQVYKAFCELAEQWRNSGHTKCSAALLGNVLRWQCEINTKSNDGFKISNDWLPFYARVLALNDPSYFNFFEFQGVNK